MNKVRITCKDGTVLTEEHLKALKIGESLQLNNVVKIYFKNVTISDDIKIEDNE